MQSINFWNKQLLQNLMKKIHTRHFVKIWEELNMKTKCLINLAEVCWYDGRLKAIMTKTLCICAGHKVFSHKSFDLNHISTVWQKHAAPRHQRICPKNMYQYFFFWLSNKSTLLVSNSCVYQKWFVYPERNQRGMKKKNSLRDARISPYY